MGYEDAFIELIQTLHVCVTVYALSIMKERRTHTRHCVDERKS